jgi:hypothetical protein
VLAARHSAISVYSAANPGSSRAAGWMMQSTGDGRTDVVRSADPRLGVDLKPAQKRLICAQSNVMLNDLTSHAESAGVIEEQITTLRPCNARYTGDYR